MTKREPRPFTKRDLVYTLAFLGLLFLGVGAFALGEDRVSSHGLDAVAISTMAAASIFLVAGILKLIRVERGNRAAEPGKRVPEIPGSCPAISDRTAVLACGVTLILAVVFGFLFSRLGQLHLQKDDTLLMVALVCPWVFGSGTLLALFHDRRWWTPPHQGWMLGFNFLTMGLAPLIGGVIKMIWAQ